MAEFRRSGSGGGFGRDSRGGGRGGNRGGFGGGRGRFGGRDRDSGRSERRPLEMHDATCGKCGKQCQVPFRPTGDKPVYCSDCFRNSEGSNGGFGSRELRSNQSGISSEQLNQINKKLDQILEFIKNLDVEIASDSDDNLVDELEDDDEKTEDKPQNK